jgi:uncharacterized delta-60 repeat protein
VNDFPLVRYASAGALDTSFGQGGMVLVPGSGSGRAVAVQPDGKILVAARLGPSVDFALLRYTASGLPDSSFGSGGRVLTDFGGDDDPASIAVRPDGRIVLAGSSKFNSVTRTALASYLPDGQPDPSFGTGGKLLIGTGPDGGGATAMTLQPDGKIDFVGTYNGNWYLARLSAGGTPDTSFGAGGTVVTDFAGQNDQAMGLTCEGGGDILVAGSATVGGVGYAGLAFYTPSGALDLTRGAAGKVTTSFGLSGYTHAVDTAVAVAVQPADGKIVIAANISRSADQFPIGQLAWGLARYTAAGSLDPTFGTGGISVSMSIVNGAYKGTNVAGMALQDDGKIVLAGTPYLSGLSVSRGDFVVARYLGDGGAPVSSPFSGQPVSVPAGTIEAENFDNGGEGVAYHDSTPQNIGGAYRNGSVDVLALAGASNGFAVGYTDTGEWLKYSINVSAAGTYVLQSRVASYLPGGAFHVEVDGTNRTGTINVPDTGGWSNWHTLASQPFVLSSGKHVMRLVEDRTGILGAVANFDTFRFVAKIPVAGAGRVGLWDPGTKSFYLDTNNNGVFDKSGDTTVAWTNATSSMLPVTGDWSGGGHGKYTGLFDRSAAAWYLDRNESNVPLDSGDVVYARYGNSGDLPVVGDWTGNGKTRVGTWRPSQNSFTLDLNGDGVWESGIDRWFQITLPFSSSDSYMPVVGDWNGDGKTQIGFFDLSTHTWYLDQNQVTDATHVFSRVTFGNSWDLPLIGRWNTAYAFSQLGTWRSSDSTIRLDFNGNGAFDAGDRSYPGWGLAVNDSPVGI